jgi:hypothetical protein
MITTTIAAMARRREQIFHGAVSRRLPAAVTVRVKDRHDGVMICRAAVIAAERPFGCQTMFAEHRYLPPRS